MNSGGGLCPFLGHFFKCLKAEFTGAKNVTLASLSSSPATISGKSLTSLVSLRKDFLSCLRTCQMVSVSFPGPGLLGCFLPSEEERYSRSHRLGPPVNSTGSLCSSIGRMCISPADEEGWDDESTCCCC